MPRHFLRTHDLDDAAIWRVLAAAEEATNGRCRLPGKVLGLLFAKESLRTSSALKSAIIRAGGGWLGVEGTGGTYLASDKEDLRETAQWITAYCDVLAVRAELPEDYLRSLPVPVVNALAGDDHCLGGLFQVHYLWRQFGRLDGLKIGVYGRASQSRPIKSYYRMLSRFGMRFFEDSVVPVARSTPDLCREIGENGSEIAFLPLREFIHEVDCLIVVDGQPYPGVGEEATAEFDHEYRTIGARDLALAPHARWQYVMPASLPTRVGDPKKRTVAPELDSHPQLDNWTRLAGTVHCVSGLLRELLGA